MFHRVLRPTLLSAIVASGAFAQSSPPAADLQAPAASGPPVPRNFDPQKVHDPSVILTENGVRRFFSTGAGVLLFSEDATGNWVREGRLFSEGKLPAWHNMFVPGNRGHLWAPDAIKLGDKYFVYYSVSTFGRNTSAIGLAIGGSLNPSSPQWEWEDRGAVIVSGRADRFNAIDPAIFRDDADGSLWMAFGSFWDGIHLVELDPATGMRRDPGKPPVRLAWSPEIEAPFLHRRGDQYYLFLNWGKCCRGVESTYEIRVGRSNAISGPYIDRAGADMREGGGTLILGSEGRWIGPGHPSIHVQDGREWLVHHYYDRELGGRSRLRMLPLTWDAYGWPVISQDK